MWPNPTKGKTRKKYLILEYFKLLIDTYKVINEKFSKISSIFIPWCRFRYIHTVYIKYKKNRKSEWLGFRLILWGKTQYLKQINPMHIIEKIVEKMIISIWLGKINLFHTWIGESEYVRNNSTKISKGFFVTYFITLLWSFASIKIFPFI